jgi:hypothetical protein
MNLPPHHISRWRTRDLKSLGTACGLSCTHTGADRLHGRDIAEFWKMQNCFAAAIGQPELPGGNWLPSLLSFVYRKLGCKFVAPRKGLSIYATFHRH